MNNSDLAEVIVAARIYRKQTRASSSMPCFVATADVVATGDVVALSGFGKFKVRASSGGEGYNPASGATIQIAASNKLTFAAAKAVKDKMNN